MNDTTTNNTNIIPNFSYRPCIVGNREALFHKWVDAVEATNNSITICTMGLIEFEYGTMETVNIEDIRFVDTYMFQSDMDYFYKADAKRIEKEISNKQEKERETALDEATLFNSFEKDLKVEFPNCYIDCNINKNALSMNQVSLSIKGYKNNKPVEIHRNGVVGDFDIFNDVILELKEEWGKY